MDDEAFFIRPAADLKKFAGIMGLKDILRQVDSLAGSKSPVTLATRVQVAKPK